MRELIAVGSQYPKALAQALAEAGEDAASPAAQRLVRGHSVAGSLALHQHMFVSRICSAAVETSPWRSYVDQHGPELPHGRP